MTSLTLPGRDPTMDLAPSGHSVDTVRALCHDLRQPLAAIMLLAATETGDVRRRLAAILDQAQWLADLVDDVLVDAAADHTTVVDVGALTWTCVLRARPTAECGVDFVGQEGALAQVQPIALGRAVSCVVDNAARAAGAGGHVEVTVTGSGGEVAVTVADDGPGLGRMQSRSSLGLVITRALVAACGGRFDLSPGCERGVVATITVPAAFSGAVAS